MRLAFVFWVILCSGSACASVLHYALDINLYPEQKHLSGIAEISGNQSEEISLSTAGLSHIKIDGQSVAAGHSFSFELNTDKAVKGENTIFAFDTGGELRFSR